MIRYLIWPGSSPLSQSTPVTSGPSSALLSASKRMMPSLVGMAHAPTSLKPSSTDSRTCESARAADPVRAQGRRLSRQRWALRSRRCAERLCVGDEIVSRNLHRSHDVLLRLLGRREPAPSKLIALRATSATAAALAALRHARPAAHVTAMSPISTFFDMTVLSRSVLPGWLIIYDNRRPSWSAWLLIGASAERSDE